MDDKKHIGSPDKERINITEAYEVQYWAAKFGVGADELKQAVKSVGPFAEEVGSYLEGRIR